MQTRSSNRSPNHETPRGASPTRPARTRKSRNRPTLVEIGLVACFALAIAIAAVSYLGPAEMHEGPVASVRVSPQQTLWEIAEDNPVAGLSTSETVDVIRSLNDMRESSLTVGQSIVVPRQELPQDAAVASR